MLDWLIVFRTVVTSSRDPQSSIIITHIGIRSEQLCETNFHRHVATFQFSNSFVRSLEKTIELQLWRTHDIYQIAKRIRPAVILHIDPVSQRTNHRYYFFSRTVSRILRIYANTTKLLILYNIGYFKSILVLGFHSIILVLVYNSLTPSSLTSNLNSHFSKLTNLL